MRKIKHDPGSWPGDDPVECYLATEVDTHLAALQAQHAEALAEKDRRIARLEEQESVIYDSFAVYSELATVDGTVSADQLSIVLDAIARIWKRLP